MAAFAGEEQIMLKRATGIGQCLNYIASHVPYTDDVSTRDNGLQTQETLGGEILPGSVTQKSHFIRI